MVWVLMVAWSNYGAGARVQLKIEGAWRAAAALSQPTRTGIGNMTLGIKWRFVEWDSGRTAVSTYPQLTLPASSGTVAKGLADSGTALARQALPSLELLGECHGAGHVQFSGIGVLCGIGMRWELGQSISALGALEAGVTGPAESRPDRRGYAGVQLRW